MRKVIYYLTRFDYFFELNQSFIAFLFCLEVSGYARFYFWEFIYIYYYTLDYIHVCSRCLLTVVCDTPIRYRIFYFRDCTFMQVGYTALCLRIISQKWTAFVFGSILYLHETFTQYMFNQCTHFDMSTYQMYL